MGENSALSRLAAMPELGKITNKQAASLAGLAPFNRDSGKMRGQRKIYGGRKDIRASNGVQARRSKLGEELP
jgi:transposase